MRVLLVNGSPHEHGCTDRALQEVAKTLQADGLETEIYWLGVKPIVGCTACFKCVQTGQCILNDVVNEFRQKAYQADGFVFGSPVHYASISASLSGFMTRLFFSEFQGNENKAFKLKPAAAVVSARRAGTTTAFSQIIKYLTVQEMLVVSSRYWNMVHGMEVDEVEADQEGLCNMRVLGHDMAYILKALETAKKYGIQMPLYEEPLFTNFVARKNATK